MLHDVTKNEQHLGELFHKPICPSWTNVFKSASFKNLKKKFNFWWQIFLSSYDFPQILFMQEKFHFHLPCMEVIAIQFFNILNIKSGHHDFEYNNAKKQNT